MSPAVTCANGSEHPGPGVNKGMMKPKITHVVFDLDGVLIDSERLYTEANAEAMAQFGGTFTRELKMRMMGRKKDLAVEILLNESGLSNKGVTVNDYMKPYDEAIYRIMSEKTEPLPGAEKLLRHFHTSGTPLAICTGSDTEEFEAKLAKYGHWLEMVPVRVLCGSDPEVKNGKPSPDAYEVTIRRKEKHYGRALDSPGNVLVFEDSENGALSALRAGCSVIMVPQLEFLPPDWMDTALPKLREEHPNLLEVLGSLEQFKPEEYGLPRFE